MTMSVSCPLLSLGSGSLSLSLFLSLDLTFGSCQLSLNFAPILRHANLRGQVGEMKFAQCIH